MMAIKRYKCRNRKCPDRAWVAAQEPPVCYTCAEPMPVFESTPHAVDPSRIVFTFNGIPITGIPLEDITIEDADD